MDILENSIKFLDMIGYLGPQLLFLSSIYFLFMNNKITSLFIYFIGFFLNILLNIILKSIIQEPRPAEDKRLFNLEVLQGKRIGFDRYGMPSGHAEGVFFSTAFIFFTLKNYWISVTYFLISLLTVYQRVKYKNHTFGQVFIGGIIGCFMGYFFYLYNNYVMKGKYREKKDDNAPYY